MSSIVTAQGILHYESIGRGKPVILLHGWINSWDVWRESMIALAQTGRFRVYALDFWGFGDSAKSQNPTHFKISSYEAMVCEFMDSLGIIRAPIVGHSMGGTVALRMAVNQRDRVGKIAVVGSPIVGKSLHPFLKLAGYGWIANMVWRYPFLLRSIMQLLLAGDSKKVRQMIFRDVQRTSIESFFRSIGDLRDTDLCPDLPSLSQPILAIYGRQDNIVSPNNAHILSSHVPSARIVMMNHSRHFPMTDEPEAFINALIQFLSE